MAVSGQINGMISDMDLVKDSMSYVTGDGRAIVAVMTEPIFTKSVRQQLMQDIIDCITESRLADEVYVTFDTDLYIRVAKLDSDSSADEIIETIEERM